MDKTPPKIEYELVGDDFAQGTRRFISARTRVRLKVTDNKAGVKEVYSSINGKKPKLYSEPSLIDEKATSVNLRYYAVDKINNSSKDAAYSGAGSLNLNIIRDENPPNISLSYATPNIIFNKMLYLRETSKITINATDGLSGVKSISYKLDDTQNDYSSAFNVSAEGNHKIVYKAVDNSNNETSESLSFYVDNTGPVINIQFGIGAIRTNTLDSSVVYVYPQRTSVFITATDQLVGYDKILYSINGAAEVESKGVIKKMKVGEYKLKVRALDELGNSNEKEIAFIIRKEIWCKKYLYPNNKENGVLRNMRLHFL